MTSFYNDHLLISSSLKTPSAHPSRYITPLTEKQVEGAMKKKNFRDFVKYRVNKVDKLVNSKIIVTPYDGNSRRIELVLDYEQKEEHVNKVIVGSVIITPTLYNCGSVHIANFFAPSRSGIGTHLMNKVCGFLEDAGYSMIFGNTAAGQNTYLPFFYKHGFKKLGPSYFNKRSGNHNVWIYKHLNNVLITDTKED